MAVWAVLVCSKAKLQGCFRSRHTFRAQAVSLELDLNTRSSGMNAATHKVGLDWQSQRCHSRRLQHRFDKTAMRAADVTTGKVTPQRVPSGVGTGAPRPAHTNAIRYIQLTEMKIRRSVQREKKEAT
ncbi:hypothetical protein EYF80_043309 [Liparis tanakae]|uniref:Uncharacterized protein n=1 Tax=Liparis tanakae TaxID=230148 RepID=A0A4Z2FZT0_9TELE|nr:hypothetical protein EYF80_043309 [Liparis tanakae]